MTTESFVGSCSTDGATLTIFGDGGASIRVPIATIRAIGEHMKTAVAAPDDGEPEKNASSNQSCPACGYCPHCGRSGAVAPYYTPYPMVPYVQPYPFRPYVWGGALTVSHPTIEWGAFGGGGTYTT